MANPNRVLAAEYVVAVGLSSWGAIRAGFFPWPGAIVRIGLGFSLLGLLATGAPELAVMLGAGFLLADVLVITGSGGLDANGRWTKTFGALPPPVANGGADYYSLGFEGKKAQ